VTPEHKAKIAAANRRPERRAQVAEQMRGNQNRKDKPSKGFRGTHSEATRAKMRSSRLAYGERIRAERRGRGGRALKGSHQSPQHVEKRLKKTHATLSKRHGPHWRKVLAKKAGAVTGSKPRSQAQLKALEEEVRAKWKPSEELRALVRRARHLSTLSRLELLLVEDIAHEEDTKKWVRSRIEPRKPKADETDLSAWEGGLKGKSITYTLENARQAGYSASKIAGALDIGKSQAYEVLELIHRADAQRPTPGPAEALPVQSSKGP